MSLKLVYLTVKTFWHLVIQAFIPSYISALYIRVWEALSSEIRYFNQYYKKMSHSVIIDRLDFK